MAEIWNDTDLRVQAMQFAIAVYNGGRQSGNILQEANNIYQFLRGPVEENVPPKADNTFHGAVLNAIRE